MRELGIVASQASSRRGGDVTAATLARFEVLRGQPRWGFAGTGTRCSITGLPTLTAPSRFIPSTCSLSDSWNASQMNFGQDCGAEMGWGVSATLPSNGVATNYALPSPAVQIDALFFTSTERFGTDGATPSLQVAPGSIAVLSLDDTSGRKASVDIEFDMRTGEHISLVGPLNYGNCVPVTTTNCN